MTEAEFDKVAEGELHHLEASLSEIDPDEVEVDFSSGVLTLTLADDQVIVINSHRAAGQIWMAAFRTAWHFSPKNEGDALAWRTEKDELRSTLSRILSERLARPITL
ncbi:MAG: iron donor protein CyaY [Polyangia bacterium]